MGPLQLEAGESREFEIPSPFAFRSVGLAWRGSFVGVELSLIDSQGKTKNSWTLSECDDLFLENSGWESLSGLVHSYSGPSYGTILRITGPAILNELALIWIPNLDSSQRQVPLAGGAGRGIPKPPVNSRLDWQADPPQCSSDYCSTTHIGVHHTASANEYLSPDWAQCSANVRSTQAYHMYTRGWCDIGYNYLVCVHGEIWEGRAGGDDIRGAHDGFNCGSMGVAMMGYFHPPHNQNPNAELLSALTKLCAWKCDQQGIDPLGTSWYAGWGGIRPNIYGHQDVKSTSCPGDLMYALLPQLRLDVEALCGVTALIFDTSQLRTLGHWTTGSSATDRYGNDYLWASSSPSVPATAWWEPNIPTTGIWEISMWWPQGSNRSTTAMLGLRTGGRLFTVVENQQLHGGQWNTLGSLQLPAGTSVKIGVANDGPLGSVVIADALRLVLRG
ncbi:MAG: N-acetylmuramoyl-L-alanine amidase [Planctomycetota bacterium]|nr:N-acetylmuramoyl-L-alanine amidase [Planctomycetota bacterium]